MPWCQRAPCFVGTPSSFSLAAIANSDIGVDYVLGLHLDDFDVEYVSLFAIEGRKP